LRILEATKEVKKDRWSDLVGKSGEEAVNIIKKETGN
jgi:hypothetical protein